MAKLRNFAKNEAWILFKLNDAPISTVEEGDFDVFALMDAASLYLLATEFVVAGAAEPSKLEAKRLLKSAKASSGKKPKKLLIAEEQAADVLAAEAKNKGISVRRVPAHDLEVLVGPARRGFAQHMGGGEP